MQSYARVDDGVAVEIINLPAGIGPSEAYHADIAASIQPCPAEVVAGWSVRDGQWSPPPPAPAASKADLLAYAADKRWRVETGGITVGGVTVATDDRSKTMIMGARIKADADPAYVVGWKGADGGFVELSASQIIAISDAVLAHVDACFAAEAAVSAAIASGDITTTQQIDDWPWPG
ncbi:hypothetical protein GCM10019059_31940 [Camelimonas fluminis]|uniref:DUF4376 domain-containing protein n=1 Tax=Camelimonas fluminis TaxID=1576911 RepID=A0ABV7UI91_9HYPH|nr:DUF4376 domain-containing protein [Camelimonas fluminis]GHE69834.1 hypothetical protein GCM10019059_31940 [Camelimonas fluminis]